ncbi:Superoxide dismutase [Mn], mitochondrial [Phytophthora boehmeriae]|uniref:Superoxide dismutase n=1 Tax=Phytophthora boehmeriae TaxID=109152 RepID=A0A8T1WW35_9STRA|nr:Superoxide dismutase [Mn], mitochondrial [Phytophthora boehmeriae]
MMLMKRAASTVSRANSRSIATVKLPDLAYDFGALEPSISGQIMEIHHQKHHQTYVNNYNAALEQYAEAEAKNDNAKMLTLLPALKFNGGGHVNHSIFWTNLAPSSQGGGGEPEGELRKAIDREFGSFEDFKKTMAAKSAAVQGSGWGWLGYSPEHKRVGVVTTPNQDPCSTTGYVPLLGIDVWEHAYYLQYKNVRPDYLKAIWEVVNWKNIEERYLVAKK